jgi:ArsR family transcriptional regulator
VYSDEAAELLQRKGFQVRRFAEGFPEWRAAGLAVEANGAVALEQRD